MKKIFAVMLALAMVLTMVACGKKADTKPEAKDKIGSAQTGMELYVTTAENGDKTVVDKSGKTAEGYTLDKSGNIVDKAGQVIVAADKVQQLPAKAEEQPKTEEPKTDTADAKSGSSNSASSDVSSSSSSSGSSSSGSSSSGGSESSSSSSSSGSSALTPTAPPQPVHTHSWQPVYRDVEVDDYEMKCFWRCNGCNADVTAILESGELMKQHFHETGNPNCMGYHSSYEQVKVGSHEEHILDHYACSCGATKAP